MGWSAHAPTWTRYEDPNRLQKLQAMIERRGGRPFLSSTDALAWAENRRWLAEPGSYLPDLLLVDLGLPKMDGYEVLRRLKGKPLLAQTRCIILSRRHGVMDKIKGRLAGASLYLPKPFTVQALLAAVQTSLIGEQ